MEVTPEMVKKLYAAGDELNRRVVQALRELDLPSEVKRDVHARAACFLLRIVVLYARLPVTVQDVFVADTRDTLAEARAALSRSLDRVPSRAGRRARVPWTELTVVEREQFASAVVRAEDALVGSLVGLGVPESDALVEVAGVMVEVFDLRKSIACS